MIARVRRGCSCSKDSLGRENRHSHTPCEAIAKRRWLGASFFFSRNEASCSNPFLVFTTIAYQLATLYPQFHNALTAILKRDPDVVGLTLEM